MEVIEDLTARQLVERGAEVVLQLEKIEKKQGTLAPSLMRPVLYMLARARARAAKAVDLIVDVDPVDADAIRNIQNELRLYNDMVLACREMISMGEEASSAVTESEREELEEVIHEMSDEDRRLYKFEPRSKD